MKYTRAFILLTGLLIFACSPPPNSQMAELQRYYALKGEGIHPAVKRPDRSNRPGKVPYLSTTNVTAPLAPMPTPLSMTNIPALPAATNAPPLPWNAPSTPVPTNTPVPSN